MSWNKSKKHIFRFNGYNATLAESYPGRNKPNLLPAMGTKP